MTSIIMRRPRTTQMQGDPVESDRLKLPFLAYVGHRTNRAVFTELGIDPKRGSRWLSDKCILPDADQRKMRLAGIGSPCA